MVGELFKPQTRANFPRYRMGNLFGKSSSKKVTVSRVTEQDKVVLQMKQQRDKLKQHRRQLENRLEKERQVAARLVRENKKERALIILRKKKHMEKLIQNVGKYRDSRNMTSLIRIVETNRRPLRFGGRRLAQIEEITRN